MTTVPPTSSVKTTLPQTALTSPYDGTVPTSLGTVGTGVPLGAAVPTLTGLTGAAGLTAPGSNGRQVNATNQTAIAPNGDVNQSVTNENSYTNKYYNIIVPSPMYGGGFGGALGGLGMLGGYGAVGGYGGYPPQGGLGGLLGGWNSPGNSYIDPKTGVMYVQQDTGISGWFKRLFRGW
jgi:hypothetical protein